MLVGIKMPNGKYYKAEKKFVHEVVDGTISNGGIPITAEPNASNERFAKLCGIQFGWYMETIDDNLFKNQYEHLFTICDHKED